MERSREIKEMISIFTLLVDGKEQRDKKRENFFKNKEMKAFIWCLST